MPEPAAPAKPPLAIVTGATGGLGFEACLGLARAGHSVLLTGRNPTRGADALQRLLAQIPSAQARFALLDTGSLASVAAFAESIDQPVAVLLNNAGIMALPTRETTVDGFERQLGVNVLGHFALTMQLLPRLQGGRVVMVSSLAHRRGRIAFDDLQSEATYHPWRAYAQSKLAMLMLALELHRRSQAHDWHVHATAAHPGWAATRIVLNGPGATASNHAGTPLKARIMQAGFNALAQSAAAGALPLLHAALDPGAKSGGYYGPCCWNETRGGPRPARISPQAADPDAQSRLWHAAEALTETGPSP